MLSDETVQEVRKLIVARLTPDDETLDSIWLQVDSEFDGFDIKVVIDTADFGGELASSILDLFVETARLVLRRGKVVSMGLKIVEKVLYPRLDIELDGFERVWSRSD